MLVGLVESINGLRAPSTSLAALAINRNDSRKHQYAQLIGPKRPCANVNILTECALITMRLLVSCLFEHELGSEDDDRDNDEHLTHRQSAINGQSSTEKKSTNGITAAATVVPLAAAANGGHASANGVGADNDDDDDDDIDDTHADDGGRENDADSDAVSQDSTNGETPRKRSKLNTSSTSLTNPTATTTPTTACNGDGLLQSAMESTSCAAETPTDNGQDATAATTPTTTTSFVKLNKRLEDFERRLDATSASIRAQTSCCCSLESESESADNINWRLVDHLIDNVDNTADNHGSSNKASTTSGVDALLTLLLDVQSQVASTSSTTTSSNNNDTMSANTRLQLLDISMHLLASLVVGRGGGAASPTRDDKSMTSQCNENGVGSGRSRRRRRRHSSSPSPSPSQRAHSVSDRLCDALSSERLTSSRRQWLRTLLLRAPSAPVRMHACAWLRRLLFSTASDEDDLSSSSSSSSSSRLKSTLVADILGGLIDARSILGDENSREVNNERRQNAELLMFAAWLSARVLSAPWADKTATLELMVDVDTLVQTLVALVEDADSGGGDANSLSLAAAVTVAATKTASNKPPLILLEAAAAGDESPEKPDEHEQDEDDDSVLLLNGAAGTTQQTAAKRSNAESLSASASASSAAACYLSPSSLASLYTLIASIQRALHTASHAALLTTTTTTTVRRRMASASLLDHLYRSLYELVDDEHVYGDADCPTTTSDDNGGGQLSTLLSRLHYAKCRAAEVRALAFELLLELSSCSCSFCQSQQQQQQENNKNTSATRSSTSLYAHMAEKLGARLSSRASSSDVNVGWDYWPRELVRRRLLCPSTDNNARTVGLSERRLALTQPRRRHQHSGLVNLGATCYMAACVQQLYHIGEVRHSILNYAPPKTG